MSAQHSHQGGAEGVTNSLDLTSAQDDEVVTLADTLVSDRVTDSRLNNIVGDFGIVDADGIYAAVRCGLCVNEVVNPATGDTLLHSAAKQDSPELAIALLQSGADTRLRNRLGRCPVDDAGPSVAAILQFFQPCLPEAVDNANFGAIRNLCHSLWINVNAIVRSGSSSLQIMANSRLPNAAKCYKVLSDFAPLSSVMHALLACDNVGLETALRENGFLPPRDADRLHRIHRCSPGPDGRSLLAVALDRGDIHAAKLLLDAGASSRGRHVAIATKALTSAPDSAIATSTQSKPLAWSVLRNPDGSALATARETAPGDTEDDAGNSISLAQPDSSEAPLDLVVQYDPVAVLTQRDSQSNTTLHAALARNSDISTLAWLIERRPALLAERNSQAQCVRELAAALYRQDALNLFEKTVKESIGTGRNSLVTMLACREHGECCLRPTRILADDAPSQAGEISAAAAERGSEFERSLLCTDNGLSRIESIGREHLRACASGNLKLVQKTNFAAFQEAATGCTGLIAAIAGEHLDVVSYLLATRGIELTRIPDNAGRYPLHYVYALMQQPDSTNENTEISPPGPSSLETPRDESSDVSNPHMAMARLIAKCDPTCWALEDSLGRKPIDMCQIGQLSEAKNMLWAGWNAGRSTTSY